MEVDGPMKAEKRLSNAEISAFCESVAMMLAAGIQTDEAVHMLGESQGAGFEAQAGAGGANALRADSSREASAENRSAATPLGRVCAAVYGEIVDGARLSVALERTEAFPEYAVSMIAVGERAGRLENTLRSLAVYYDEADRVFAKIRSAVGYPAALLCVMSVIVAVTVGAILPVFISVYERLAGSLTAGSSFAVSAATAVGWAALAITIVATAAALATLAASRTKRGNAALARALERIPLTRQAMYRLALSRFTSTLATYLASGMDADASMHDAIALVDHPRLRERAERAYATMIDLDRGLGLGQAIAESELLEPVYARMLAIGSRTGSIDGVLAQLSDTFFDDAISRIDHAVDSIEPVLAAFLTVAVGATLISVMLPLIGIMGSIG